MPSDDFAVATRPLLEAGQVDALEWSFDIGWGVAPPPSWLTGLLDFFSENDRLYGHGVTFSPLSGAWHQRQEAWLSRLAEECEARRYLHITEHFGFMTAGDFHRSAPLPVPMTEEALRLGRERLRRLAATVECPVGLENLAFAFGMQDVRQQGEFLERLLEPVEGILLLDCHNLYCQICNFEVDAVELLESYPLQRVRELHVSGGSWSASSVGDGAPVRRDTHDNRVPAEVFDLTALALSRCPDVELVVLEWLGDQLPEKQHAGFRQDYEQLQQIVASSRT